MLFNTWIRTFDPDEDEEDDWAIGFHYKEPSEKTEQDRLVNFRIQFESTRHVHFHWGRFISRGPLVEPHHEIHGGQIVFPSFSCVFTQLKNFEHPDFVSCCLWRPHNVTVYFLSAIAFWIRSVLIKYS